MGQGDSLPDGLYFSNQESLDLECKKLLEQLAHTIVDGDPILRACEALNSQNLLEDSESFMRNYNLIAENNYGKYDQLLETIIRRAFEQIFVGLYDRGIVETTTEAALYIADQENGILLTPRRFGKDQLDPVEKYEDIEILLNPLLVSVFQDFPEELRRKIFQDVRVYFIKRNEEYPGGRGGLNSQGIPFVVSQDNFDNTTIVWNEVAHVVLNRLLETFEIYDIFSSNIYIILDGEKVSLIEISEYLSDISSYGYNSDTISIVGKRDPGVNIFYYFSQSRFKIAAGLSSEEAQKNFFERDMRNILQLLLEKLSS